MARQTVDPGPPAEQPSWIAIGSNPERNRTHNRRVVLEAIRSHGALGRTGIARLAHLTAQAVANIVDELVREELLVETGRLRTGRGQPPMQFAVNPNGPMTAGVEIAADHITTVLLDLAGTVRAQARIASVGAAPSAIVDTVAGEIARLGAGLPRSPRLLGVGVVMPGPFEIEGMTSVGPATLPGWAAIDALATLQAAIDAPVIVENDATAAAVGERLHGAGRSAQDFCFVYFGVGLGLGIIQNGRPMRGAFGNAGEIGHLLVPSRRGGEDRGLPLESVASLFALREHLAGYGLVPQTVADLEQLFAAGNPVLLEWIARVADYLAPLVALLENILDPETVILGGNLPDPVIDAIIAALEPLPVSVATRRHRTLPRVLRGQTGHLTAALGAAALPLFETMTPRLHVSSSAAAASGAATQA